MTIRELIYTTYMTMMEGVYGIPNTTCPAGVDPDVWAAQGGDISATQIRDKWEEYGAVLADTFLASLRGNTLDGQTLWGAPTIGELGYLSGDNAWTKATAATSDATARVRGVYQGNAGQVQIGGIAEVKLVAALVGLTANQVVITSTAAGQGTVVGGASAPVAGQYLCEIGTIYDASIYATTQRVKVLFAPGMVVGL